MCSLLSKRINDIWIFLLIYNIIETNILHCQRKKWDVYQTEFNTDRRCV